MSAKREEIATILVDSNDEEKIGTIIVSVFDESEIGICISQKSGGDAELWLDLKLTKTVLLAIEEAMKIIK